MRALALLLVVASVGLAYADAQPPVAIGTPKLVNTPSVSRVIDGGAGVAASAIETAVRTPALDKCKATPKPLVAWVAFERGKVVLADVAGIDDAALRGCIASALKKATLPPTTPRVVALVDVAAVPQAAPAMPLESANTMLVGKGSIDSGSFTTEEINEVMKANASKIRNCYQQELKRSPTLAGKIVVVFTIEGNGSVSAVAVKESMTGGGAVTACVKTEIGKLKFPPKGPARVSYPFVFSQGG
jgi:hypothetical protein